MLLLWKVPQWQTAPWRASLTPKDQLEIEDDLRRTLVLLLAGESIVLALALVLRRIAANERATRAGMEVAREAQRGERFSRAVAELADDRAEVRIGAVYTLEQLGRESPTQHAPIIEVLCAFVRDHTAWEADRPPAALPVDVQAVLTVLGRRERAPEREEVLDLRRTDLRGADLNGVHFEKALLSEAHLDGASLQGAHLERADLRGAQLVSADLVQAHLNNADLRDADLEAAYLVEAHLEGADLGNASLGGAYLGGAHLEGADLSGADLGGAYLYQANLEGASLQGAQAMSATGINRDERERMHGADTEEHDPPAPRQLASVPPLVSLRSRRLKAKRREPDTEPPRLHDRSRKG